MTLIIRSLGIIALILGVIPFQFKKHKHIVLCKMASETVFAIQYLLNCVVLQIRDYYCVKSLGCEDGKICEFTKKDYSKV